MKIISKGVFDKSKNNEDANKIPKIIHFCWFGKNPKTKLVKKCIKSWKKYLPDYEIWEWNDKDLKKCQNIYVLEAYKAKKWAFITDYFRLYALYNFGGIYFDSDNEVFKSFDDFLSLDFFSGYENWNGVISPFTAVVGSKKGNHIIKSLLDEYKDLHFIKENGEYELLTNTARVTDYFKTKYDFIEPYNENEMKILENNCIIYPSNILCKYDEGISYAVHHFNGSWLPKKNKTSFLQKIFSVVNSKDKKHKIIRILGAKISIKNFKYKNKELTYIFKSKGHNVLIQDNCRIYNTESIKLGNNILIGQGALIEGIGGLDIGDNVIFGPDVTIWTANHNYYNPNLLPYDEKVNNKPVSIGNNVWLGAKCIIIPGVSIGDGAIIGMGAVVNKDIPKGAVVCGNPAQIVKYRDMNKYEELVKNNCYYDITNDFKNRS